MCKTLKELIALPNCDHNCPIDYKGRIKGCCTHCTHFKGYFEKGEIKDRIFYGVITREEADYVMELVTTEPYGALDPGKGCVLSRRLRSKICLSYDCKVEE